MIFNGLILCLEEHGLFNNPEGKVEGIIVEFNENSLNLKLTLTHDMAYNSLKDSGYPNTIVGKICGLIAEADQYGWIKDYSRSLFGDNILNISLELIKRPETK